MPNYGKPSFNVFIQPSVPNVVITKSFENISKANFSPIYTKTEQTIIKLESQTSSQKLGEYT